MLASALQAAFDKEGVIVAVRRKPESYVPDKAYSSQRTFAMSELQTTLSTIGTVHMTHAPPQRDYIRWKSGTLISIVHCYEVEWERCINLTTENGILKINDKTPVEWIQSKWKDVVQPDPSLFQTLSNELKGNHVTQAKNMFTVKSVYQFRTPELFVLLDPRKKCKPDLVTDEELQSAKRDEPDWNPLLTMLTWWVDHLQRMDVKRDIVFVWQNEIIGKNITEEPALWYEMMCKHNLAVRNYLLLRENETSIKLTLPTEEEKKKKKKASVPKKKTKKRKTSDDDDSNSDGEGIAVGISKVDIRGRYLAYCKDKYITTEIDGFEAKIRKHLTSKKYKSDPVTYALELNGEEKQINNVVFSAVWEIAHDNPIDWKEVEAKAEELKAGNAKKRLKMLKKMGKEGSDDDDDDDDGGEDYKPPSPKKRKQTPVKPKEQEKKKETKKRDAPKRKELKIAPTTAEPETKKKVKGPPPAPPPLSEDQKKRMNDHKSTEVYYHCYLDSDGDMLVKPLFDLSKHILKAGDANLISTAAPVFFLEDKTYEPTNGRLFEMDIAGTIPIKPHMDLGWRRSLQRAQMTRMEWMFRDQRTGEEGTVVSGDFKPESEKKLHPFTEKCTNSTYRLALSYFYHSCERMRIRDDVIKHVLTCIIGFLNKSKSQLSIGMVYDNVKATLNVYFAVYSYVTPAFRAYTPIERKYRFSLASRFESEETIQKLIAKAASAIINVPSPLAMIARAPSTAAAIIRTPSSTPTATSSTASTTHKPQSPPSPDPLLSGLHMKTEAEVQEFIESILTTIGLQCRVCWKIAVVPISMICCGMTLCSDCLHNWSTTDNGKGGTCPQCNILVHKPDKKRDDAALKRGGCSSNILAAGLDVILKRKTITPREYNDNRESVRRQKLFLPQCRQIINKLVDQRGSTSLTNRPVFTSEQLPDAKDTACILAMTAAIGEWKLSHTNHEFHPHIHDGSLYVVNKADFANITFPTRSARSHRIISEASM